MTRTLTDYEVLERSSPQNRRLLRQEELILEVTEALSHALAREQVTKKALADRLGKSRAFVSQVLAGGRNLTLRTVAEIADALGYRLVVRLSKAGAMRESVTSPSFVLGGPRVVGPAFVGGRRLVAGPGFLAFGARKYAKAAKRRGRPRPKRKRRK
ncbi:MAG: helix-turn-helix domain-containing protein [candidate division NC10 bacterium]|nr:helix-turn-helix domain-containing protein [candidate division NC10 bacterium]